MCVAYYKNRANIFEDKFSFVRKSVMVAWLVG